jgi:hypothetical protein
VATRPRRRRANPGKAKRAAPAPTRGERNVKWIESYCRIPEGRDVGKPVRLRDWQKADIRKIYDNPAGTRMAILSFAKKNAKTSLAAFLLLLHLVGPEAVPNTQLPSTAQSREQAAVLFNLAAKCVRLSPELSAVIQIRDTAKQLACPELGTLYKALSAEASTAHGQSPIFAVHDELGQVRGPVSELFNAIENAMGAHESPLSVVISTQAPTDGDLLSILIDDGLAGHDPRIVVSLYTAPLELDPFSEEAIRAANPAFGDFLNSKEVLDQAERAKRIPSQEALYRNYTLNQRVEASSPFVSRSLWLSCAAPAKPIEGVPVYGGLDLSEVNDLTALVLIGKVDGIWQAHPTFWLPEEGLVERARRDRVVPFRLYQETGRRPEDRDRSSAAHADQPQAERLADQPRISGDDQLPSRPDLQRLRVRQPRRHRARGSRADPDRAGPGARRAATDYALRYYVRGKDGVEQEFGQDAIWHLRGPSWNSWIGHGRGRLARNAIGLSLGARAGQSDVQKNGPQTTASTASRKTSRRRNSSFSRRGWTSICRAASAPASR